MDIERLIIMANDIGNFFGSEPDQAVAVQGIAEHLKKFWDPRMRQAIVAYNREGGVGLSDPVRRAVSTLATTTDSQS